MSLLVLALILVTAGLAAGSGYLVGQRRQLEQLARQLDASTANTPGRLAAEVRRQQASLESHHREHETAVERLRAALDRVTQGVVIVDDTGRNVYTNRFADGFVSARHGDALVEEAMRELLGDALKGEAAEREVDLFGPPRRTLLVSAQPLVGSRERIGAAVLIDDVTEQHRLDAVRRDFVANVSHELKTPVGALSLLAETLVGETDPAHIESLSGRLNAEAFRLTRLIDDLLDLSRLEGPGSMAVASIRVAELVNEALTRVRPFADQHHITIEVGPIADSIVMWCDRPQMVSALHNLLENAVKYSDAGGSVTLRVAATADEVAVAVEDHGIGIPAGSLDRIFERFYRVDRGRSRATGGTGLGLSIVRHVATNHGGTVRVVSREGMGSTFTILVPVGTGPVSVVPIDFFPQPSEVVPPDGERRGA